jgi:hypothetical protein
VNRRRALSALAVGIVGADFRPAKGFAPNLSRENIDWVVQVHKSMSGITSGMARADLLKAFTTEGGLSTGPQRTFVSLQCPYFKVDVTFAHTAASTTEYPMSSRRQSRKRAMEKTQASPAWKAPLSFPTLPQLRRRDKFVRPTMRFLGAGHLVEYF